VAAGPAQQEAAPAAEKWEEIWRPRRRGRALEQPRREKRAHRPRQKDGAEAAAAPASQSSQGPQSTQSGKPERRESKGPHRRRDHRRQGPGQRSERPRPQMQASPSTSKAKVAFDPDSPFAALSSLKAAMEKRSQE
jgi:hypothetical protein